MADKRTRKEILTDLCAKALATPKNFYREGFLNDKGTTRDTKELNTEVMAEFIINNIEIFEKGIEPERRGCYKDTNHKDLSSSKSVRSTEELFEVSEKDLAKELFTLYKKKTLPPIGTIVDVETPLTARQTEDPKPDHKTEYRGDIDLLADDGKRLIILELKKPGNEDESMLRCVMECYTYLKNVNHDILIKNFVKNQTLHDSYIVTASPLVFKGGRQYKEMQENRPQLKKLMKLLNITPLYYRYDDAANEFVITYK